MAVIIVAGALANKTGNGGGAWERLSWVVGLRRLGFDVYFVEQIAREACVDNMGAVTRFEDSVNLDWFRLVTQWFGVGDRSALVYGGEQCAGIEWRQLLRLAESAELLVNLSGHLTLASLVERIRNKAYIDVDPGFTQFWHADPSTPWHVGGHDFYFTIGENIGSPDCPIPTSGIRWRPTRQPVLLKQWVMEEEGVRNILPERLESYRAPKKFTTVGSWRGPFGPVQYGGQTFGVKVHEFRKFVELPARSPQTFEIALDIHPADGKDRKLLEDHHWQIVDPKVVACHPERFRRYVQQSDAEFSVAQGVYVDTNSGWFSDRTTRYLAAGKPALVQDTGFSQNISVGEGLIAFRTLDEAVAGAERIASDYDRHSQAARRLAEEYFDSDQVISRLLSEVGVSA